jgi:hypothetical protein
MNINNYNADLHRHRLAGWAAATAANQATDFRFDVQGGIALLGLAANGKDLLGCTADADGLDRFLSHIKSVRDVAEQEQFDAWHAESLENMLSPSGLGTVIEKINQKKKKKSSSPKLVAPQDFTYGIAAKLLNVYLKVFYLNSLDDDGPPFVRYIHPPIDRLLLSDLQKQEGPEGAELAQCIKKLAGDSKSVPTWTKMRRCDYEELIQAITKYLKANGLTEMWKIEFAWQGHQ